MRCNGGRAEARQSCCRRTKHAADACPTFSGGASRRTCRRGVCCRRARGCDMAWHVTSRHALGAGLPEPLAAPLDLEYAAVSKTILAGKVLAEATLERLRHLAAAQPAQELARALCRIVLFPPKVPPAAWPIIYRAAGVDDDALRDELMGATDASPSKRLLAVCRS